MNHIGVQARSASDACSLPRLARVLNAVAVVAQGRAVQLEGAGEHLIVRGHDGHSEVQALVPAGHATGSLLVRFDALFEPVRELAAERREPATDRRCVSIMWDEHPPPLLAVDGRPVLRLELSYDALPDDRDTPPIRAVVGREALVAAIPPRLPIRPESRWWKTDLDIDVFDSKVRVATHDRLVTTVATMDASTNGVDALGDELSLPAPLIASVARWFAAETVEIGYATYGSGSYSVMLRCGDLTVRTNTLYGLSAARPHAEIATQPPPHACAYIDRLALIDALERFADNEPTGNLAVMLGSFENTTVAAVPVVARTPRFDEADTIGAHVRHANELPDVLVRADQLLHALHRFCSQRVALQVPKHLGPIVLTEPSYPAQHARRIVIDQLPG